MGRQELPSDNALQSEVWAEPSCESRERCAWSLSLSLAATSFSPSALTEENFYHFHFEDNLWQGILIVTNKPEALVVLSLAGIRKGNRRIRKRPILSEVFSWIPVSGTNVYVNTHTLSPRRLAIGIGSQPRENWRGRAKKSLKECRDTLPFLLFLPTS